MEFWRTLAGLLRHKWVVIPIAAVSMTMGVGAYVATPASYKSSTLLVLTTTQFVNGDTQNPTDPSFRSNPMLNFNDSLITTSNILIQAMKSQDLATRLGANGSTTVQIDDGQSNPDLIGPNGPFIYITVVSSTPEEAERVLAEARTVTEEQLDDWQGALGAPAKTYVKPVEVTPSTSPTVEHGRGVKFGILASVFGIVVMLGGVYARHQMKARRTVREDVGLALVEAAKPRDSPPKPRPRRSVQDSTPGAAKPPRNGPAPAASPKPRPSKPRPAANPARQKKSGQQELEPVPVKPSVRSRSR